MSNKSESYTWPLLLRKISLVALIIFLIVLTLVIFFGAKEKKIPLAGTEPAAADNVRSLEENLTAVEFRAEGGKIKIRADLASIDQKGNQLLSGNVEFIQDRSDFNLRLKAREATIGSDKEELSARGTVEVESGEVRLSATNLTYQMKSGLLQVENLKLTIGPLEISAPQADYYSVGRKGSCPQGAVLTLVGLKPPLVVKGERLMFDLDSGQVEADGFMFENGSWSGLASVGTLLLAQANFEPMKIELAGKAFFKLRQEEDSATFNHLDLKSDRIILTRQQVDWTLLVPDGWEMRAEDSQQKVEGNGEKIELTFKPGGQATYFLAQAATLIVFKDGKKEVELQADRLKEDLLSGLISLDASARLISNEFRLEASWLQFDLASSGFRAEQAQLEISPIFFKSAGPFFKADRPLLAYGQEARSSSQRIELSGQVTIWQEENVFGCDQAFFDKETGEINLAGGIKANLAYGSPAGSRVKGAEIRAGQLSLQPADRAIRAWEKAAFSGGGVKIQAQQLTFYFEGGKSDELTSLKMSGVVRLVWKDYEFQATEGLYFPAEEIFVFSGQATFKDTEGNLVEADKLTLFTLDDRITVENKGKKRAMTVLRRAK